MSSIQTMLQKRRLRWPGHVKRMPDGRMQKDILHGALAEGSRGHRRPLLRYRDVIKRGLNATGIHIRNWEELALDRSRWRTQVQEGTSQAETAFGHGGGKERSSKAQGH